jgi:hypothetical protein
MTLYQVMVTRTSMYHVDALDSDSAEHAVLDAEAGLNSHTSTTIPELVNTEVSGVVSDKVDERMVVQVNFNDSLSTRTYAFAVPEGLSVCIDDDVLVYSHIRNRVEVAKIVDVGRGDYVGPLAEIVGKVEYPETHPGIDRSVRSK